MGLDTVELVMEMEETFDITIDDLDAEKIGTVGQAYRYILSRVRLSRDAPCQSASAFYRIRRGLMARTGADRRSIRPASRLADFLPAVGRREAWLGLGDELGVAMPRLALGSRLELVTCLLASLAPVAGLFVAWMWLGPFSASSMPLILAGWFALTLCFLAAATLALRPFASEIPPGCETVRGLVLTTLGRWPRPPEGAAKTWHPDEVWTVLRDLISEQLGIPRDLITEEKHFVYDLGAD
jgi:acyl carrier protein